MRAAGRGRGRSKGRGPRRRVLRAQQGHWCGQQGSVLAEEASGLLGCVPGSPGGQGQGSSCCCG